MATESTEYGFGVRKAVRHGRHGRSGRSSVTGPHLPPLTPRVDSFDQTVGNTAEFLRGMWPQELQGVRYEIGTVPPANPAIPGPRRWDALRSEGRIILYRIPIQRLGRLHVDDELHRQMHIEACVFRATAEYLGREPWDLGPERFRFFH